MGSSSSAVATYFVLVAERIEQAIAKPLMLSKHSFHRYVVWFQSGWRLEGQAHSTIQELIIQQHKSMTAVTNKSQAILTAPVMRETWQIKNDDIKLEDKIGNVSEFIIFCRLFIRKDICLVLYAFKGITIA